MSIHRFFIKNINVRGNKVNLPKDQARQLRQVLRLSKKDKITLIDEDANELLTELEVVANDFATGTILEKSKNNNEPALKIALYQALLPREKFETVLQKGTEVGVSYFIPIETEHSLPDSKVTTKDKLERWEKIIKEASEQSERGKLPQITQAIKFEEAIKEAVGFGPTLIAWERSDNLNTKSILQKLSLRDHEVSKQSGFDMDSTKIATDSTNPRNDTPKNISVFIGPEGGFSKKEIEFAIEEGATPISLGKRILRSETAGPILSSILLYEFD